MPPEEGTLIGGPQDGVKVRRTGGLPLWVHVGPKWMGDGFAAWSRAPSERFPARYVWDGYSSWQFECWRTAPLPEQMPLESCRG